MTALAQGCLVFMLVGSPAEERQAGVLIESLQRSGGPLARCELQVVLADPAQTPGQGLRARGAVLLALERSPLLEAYPFGSKVLACAQVEKAAAPHARTLVYLDTDVLVLKPQPALLLAKGEGAALRPVHLVNEVGLPEGAPADEYWARIRAASGLGQNEVPVVASLVDARRIQAYYNCAVFSVRREAGILGEWARVFATLVADQAFQREACVEPRHRLFLHQAVLSSLLVARLGTPRIRLLPDGYGYPLHLHQRVPPALRPRAFDELASFIYEDARGGSGWLSLLPASARVRQRLEEAQRALSR